MIKGRGGGQRLLFPHYHVGLTSKKKTMERSKGAQGQLEAQVHGTRTEKKISSGKAFVRYEFPSGRSRTTAGERGVAHIRRGLTKERRRGWKRGPGRTELETYGTQLTDRTERKGLRKKE